MSDLATGDQLTVSSGAELDAVLEAVHARGYRAVVLVVQPSEEEPGSDDDDPFAAGYRAGAHGSSLAVGLGDPDRALLLWDGWQYPTGDATVDAGPDGLHFASDYYFAGPDRAVSPQTARAAAVEYVTTGQRPRAVHWTSDPPQ